MSRKGILMTGKERGLVIFSSLLCHHHEVQLLQERERQKYNQATKHSNYFCVIAERVNLDLVEL